MADARLRLRSVARLARVLAQPTDLLGLLEIAAHEIRFALGAASVSVGRLERERGVVRTLVNIGELADWEQRRPEDETYSITALPMMALLVDDAVTWTVDVDDPVADRASRDLLASLGKGSGIAAPILLDGRVWGELWATRSLRAPRFGDEDMEVAEALAAVLASGIAQVQRVADMERLVYTDPLTGLANRRALDLALETALLDRERTGGPVAVVMADVNGLKTTNDTEGHAAGDRLIRTCADAISRATGMFPGALAGRLAGDEFAVVLPRASLEQAEELGTAILTMLGRTRYPLALAVGAASTEAEGVEGAVTASRLLGWADEAQYAAKAEGSGRVVLAGRDTALRDPVERRARARGGPARASDADRAARGLEAGLRVLAGTAELSPLDRVVAAVDGLADAVDAVGWVVSILDGGATRTVAFSGGRDGLRVDDPLPLEGLADLLTAASAVGVVVEEDTDPLLPGARGCRSVVVAVSGRWVVELLGDRTGLAPAAAPLRSLLGAALAG